MRLATVIILLGMVLQSAFAQKISKSQDADEILTRVVKGFEGVKDFSASIDAEVNMERMQIPKMHAELLFKKPDKVHFSSKGFLLVPREEVALNPSALHEHYLATSVMTDTVDGKAMYKLLLAAKDQKTRLRSLLVWIDGTNWTVVRMETIPYEGRTLSMRFTYECQEGKYWLPSKLIASFASDAEKTQKDASTSMENQLDGMQRSMPRNGSITILYSNYKVNCGLTDDMFENKEK
jgi:outer membrane lipoprotein-sorting protein